MHAETVDGLTVVALAGELDLAAASTLRLAPRHAPDAALPDLAVDLSQVEFMDCAVVGVLIAALKTVKAQGGCLRLHGFKGGPMRLIELCKLDGVICVHDTAAAANAARCERHGTTHQLIPGGPVA